MPGPGTTEFLEARDCLLHAPNYLEAKSHFSWPNPHNFNWALDYFDTLAERTINPALLYVDDKGTVKEFSFREMRETSNRVANCLRSLEVGKGDRTLVMMANRPELFQLILGAMKVGCVIIPASTLLTTEDLRDRIGRGKVRCIITETELTGRVDNALPAGANVSKISFGERKGGWLDFNEIGSHSAAFKPEESFAMNDELLIYFTSGTTAKPKLVLHTYGSYPVGNLTTMYWIGMRSGELHYNVSQPGWAKYA